MFRIWVINNIQAAGKHLNIAGVIPIKLFDSLLDSAASIISICSIGSSRIGMYGESLVSWRSSATISWGFNNCSKCILNSSSDGASFCISSRSPFHPIDFHIFLWSSSFSNLFQRSVFPHGDGGDACLLAIGQQAISCFLNSWQHLLAHGLRKVIFIEMLHHIKRSNVLYAWFRDNESVRLRDPSGFLPKRQVSLEVMCTLF